MKKLSNIIFVLFVFAITAMSAAASTVTFGDLSLPVPDEYDELLVIEKDKDPMLISISEKESIEAAEAQNYTYDGVGWLFGIGTVSEEELHELLCNDMSGMTVFAKDAEDTYYIYYHPTDVRMVRDDYTDPVAWESWMMISDWASTVPETLIEENDVLTAASYGNTDPEIYFYRMMYWDDIEYTVSTNEYGPQEPGELDAANYIKPLTENVAYLFAENEEAPDGEYVVLNFPKDDVRFDFFSANTAGNNYLRMVWNNEKNEMLYRVIFEDENINITEIMNNFYQDIVLFNSLVNN